MALPKNDYPIHNFKSPTTGESIKFRPFLVKEEKILLIASESEDEKEHIEALKQIITNCVLEKDFDVDNMSIYDFTQFFLDLRAKSVGEQVELKIKCSHCDKFNDYNFNINSLKFDKVDIDNYIVKLNDKYSLKMRIPTVKMFNVLFDVEKSLMPYITILECIESIFDDEQEYKLADETLEEQITWLESLSNKEIQKIQDWTSKIPEVKTEIKFACDGCNKENVKSLTSIADFF